MTWDQIPLSLRNYLKFSLEMASIAFAVGPVIVFAGTRSFADTGVATLICLPLFVILLVIMRIVEREMYEVLKGMRRGKIWYNLR